MSAGPAPVLPVVQLGIDYDDQRDKIGQFISQYTTQRGNLLHYDSEGRLVSQVHQPNDRLAPGASGGYLPPEFEQQQPEQLVLNPVERESPVQKYALLLQQIANRELDTLIVDIDDLLEFSANGDKTFGIELADNVLANTKRYVDLFCQVVDKLMPPPTKNISDKDDVLDVIIHQRKEQMQRERVERAAQAATHGETMAEDALDVDEEKVFPPALLRRYALYFNPPKSVKPFSVRETRGAHLGKLIALRGIVTRVSEVKPFLQVEAVACDVCGAEIFTEITSRSYLPTTFCTSKTCTINKVKSPVYPQNRASKFVPFQEIKIQEMADQVPIGHIPRTLTIHLYGTLTRSMNPGDVVEVGGIFLPIPFTGMQAVRAGLLTDTYLEAHSVKQLKKQYQYMELTPEVSETINDIRRDGALFERLARSIAPEIYGHEDVKKALLLLLVGGVTKQMSDGMKIRGDINICLMGDPGVAKSQLLKYISKVAPRGVYTTGRGSSGVGLTAAVMRDPVTDEMVLEGGALVLADNGIACIDEFDKMEESDRTAIHEVMEQQTISISKAGITTTLNARTAILAAANPLYGRYNPKVSPVDNINLPAALLSRFDVLFLILDVPSRDDDERLASHVTHVHMFNEPPERQIQTLDANIMRHYIALARQLEPSIPPAVSDYIVGSYVKMRTNHKEDEAREQAFTYTSARTLLGVVRLSQALARLRFDSLVDTADVDEALRLMEVSKASLFDPAGEDDLGHDASFMTKIYRIIREMAFSAGEAEPRLGHGPGGERDDDMDIDTGVATLGTLEMRDVHDRIIAAGWLENQLQETINEYQSLGVLSVTDDDHLIFL